MKVEKFFNELFGSLDVFIGENGELWFYGVMVAAILGYVVPGKAVQDHVDKNDRKAAKYKAFSKTEKAFEALWNKENDFSDKVLINEAGLYSLIFSSKLEKAIEFRNWVTHEVLPSIRKNGGYISGQEDLGAEDYRELIATVKALSDKVKWLRARRNKYRTENLKLHEKVKSLKKERKALNKENDALNGYCTLREDMYDNLLRDYRFLQEKVEPKTAYKAPEAKKRMSVTTDRFGNVLDIQWTA